MYDTNMSTDELYHYGVKGMRWGVRRASKQLSNATDSATGTKAVAKLNKHREKASAKVAKLEKKHVKLQKNVDKAVSETDTAVTKMMRKSTHLRNKAYGRFTSEEKASKLLYKADKLKARAEEMKAKSDDAKAKLAKNEKMTQMFKQGINDIDKALESKGRKYING